MHTTDILILGGGLVGLTTAIALDRHGIKTVVVDPAEPALTLGQGFDGRASAIASASGRLLDAIGVGARLRPHGCPIRRIEVRDGLSPGALDFTPDDGEPLGVMYENRQLRVALNACAQEAEHITLHMPDRAKTVERTEAGVIARLESGAQIRADLLIAAEGRNSPTRREARMRTAHWSYGHNAIISAFDHSEPHRNVAHEIFYPAGPFALLPMAPGNRCALVWTVSTADAPAMLALSDRAFLAEAEKRTGGLLGTLTNLAPRSTYPLNFQHAGKITGTRLALIGDAAHGIHPIAGQGLNLGFRDVAAIVEVLVEGSRLGLDLGDAQLLQRYERWRGFDTLMVAAATDTLTHLFGIPGKAARGVRRFGLGLVQRIPPLRSAFMAEARGETGALPKLLQGAMV